MTAPPLRISSKDVARRVDADALARRIAAHLIRCRRALPREASFDEDACVPDDRDLSDWKRVARALHAYVEERAFEMLDGCSVYIPLDLHTPASDPSGFVMLNSSYSARTRARALVHELAHHLLWPSLPNWGLRHQIESELAAYALRHNVARRVVDLCFLRENTRVPPVSFRRSCR